MTHYTSNIVAALIAVVITASSLSAITQVPGEAQLAIVSAPVLA